jgi:hypothetical protein
MDPTNSGECRAWDSEVTGTCSELYVKRFSTGPWHQMRHGISKRE